MIENRKIFALIPARAGSKRLQNKNLRELNGKPLIAWTIEAALESAIADYLLVSTDSSDIAAVALDAGAQVPFSRPDDISGDNASTFDVIQHAIGWLQKSGESFDYLLLLQPTSPLRSEFHIREAAKLLVSKQADAVIGVTPLDHPVEWTNTLDENLSMDGFLSAQNIGKRSQDFPVRYRINGAIYLLNIERMLQEKRVIPEKNAFAYIMDAQSSVDIDTQLDLDYADFLMRRRQGDKI